MNTGMLWFDGANTSITEKVKKASEYYEKKYGRKPDLCLVNPSMLEGAKLEEITGIVVRPYRPVLPGHIWIGVEEMPTAPKEETPA